jgi:hypothetical protein
MDALAKSGVRAASFTFRTKMLWAWQYSRMSWLHDAYCFSRLLACVCNLQHAFPGWRRLSQSVPAGSAQRARARARRGPSREERRPAVQRGEPKRRLGLRRRHGAGAGPRGWRGRGRGRAARRPATYSVGTQVCGVRKTSPSFVLPPAWDFAAAAWPPLVLLRGMARVAGRARGARGAGRGARGAARSERASVDRPRCQPGLRLKPHLWPHGAVQISADRRAYRSTGPVGAPPSSTPRDRSTVDSLDRSTRPLTGVHRGCPNYVGRILPPPPCNSHIV